MNSIIQGQARILWHWFADGINGTKGECGNPRGLALSWQSFGMMQAVDAFVDAPELVAIAQYCKAFDRGDVDLEGGCHAA